MKNSFLLFFFKTYHVLRFISNWISLFGKISFGNGSLLVCFDLFKSLYYTKSIQFKKSNKGLNSRPFFTWWRETDSMNKRVLLSSKKNYFSKEYSERPVCSDQQRMKCVASNTFCSTMSPSSFIQAGGLPCLSNQL